MFENLTKFQKGIIIVATPFILAYLFTIIKLAGWGALFAVFILAITVACVLIGYKFLKQAAEEGDMLGKKKTDF
jgi:O-antigen/teichoic acid export membrane protein